MPASPLTPLSEPVLPRILPASGVSTSSSNERAADCPATGSPSQSVLAARAGRRAPRAADERHARDPVARGRPEPSASSTSSTGTPSSFSLAEDRGRAGRGRALLRACTPSSLVNSSALRLSLELSIDPTTSFSGGEVTLATAAASAGAVPRVGAPTCTPRRA